MIMFDRTADRHHITSASNLTGASIEVYDEILLLVCQLALCQTH